MYKLPQHAFAVDTVRAVAKRDQSLLAKSAYFESVGVMPRRSVANGAWRISSVADGGIACRSNRNLFNGFRFIANISVQIIFYLRKIIMQFWPISYVLSSRQLNCIETNFGVTLKLLDIFGEHVISMHGSKQISKTNLIFLL